MLSVRIPLWLVGSAVVVSSAVAQPWNHSRTPSSLSTANTRTQDSSLLNSTNQPVVFDSTQGESNQNDPQNTQAQIVSSTGSALTETPLSTKFSSPTNPPQIIVVQQTLVLTAITKTILLASSPQKFATNQTITHVPTSPINVDQTQPTLLVASMQDPTGGERGGGDIAAVDFLAYAQAFLRDLEELHQKNAFMQIETQAVARGVAEYRIDIVQSQVMDSLQIARDAVTDTGAKTIQLFGARWLSSSISRDQKALVVVHEYLRASGFFTQDDLYTLSQQIVDSLKSQATPSHLLSVSSNQVDGLLYVMALKGHKLDCKWNGFDSNHVTKNQLTLNSTEFGIEIKITNGLGHEFTYNEKKRNIYQVSFGKGFSAFSFKIPTGGSYALTLQTPKENSKRVGGTLGKVIPQELAQGMLPETTGVACELN